MKTVWAIYRLWRQGRLNQIQRLAKGPTFEESVVNLGKGFQKAAEAMRKVPEKAKKAPIRRIT